MLECHVTECVVEGEGNTHVPQCARACATVFGAWLLDCFSLMLGLSSDAKPVVDCPMLVALEVLAPFTGVRSWVRRVS